jgi:outer membrane protein assembly factor BamA
LVAASFYVGFIADAQHVDVEGVEASPGGGTDNVPGAEGGRTIGVGGTLNWDTRDNAVDAREGGFYQLRVMTWQDWTLSEYELTRLSVDLRHFFPLDDDGAAGHTIGVQLYTELNAGDVPFHQMARLGGELLMRGYFEGRYRDKDMLAAQVEYRFPIVWRFRGVAFAAVGDVASEMTEFDFGGLEVSGGAGLRFSLNEQERLNVRADLGIGIDTWGAYVGISEAF